MNDEPEPGLVRYCHRHLEPVRMRLVSMLAPNHVQFYRCPACLHEQPLNVESAQDWRKSHLTEGEP